MSDNGTNGDARVLRWTGKLFSGDDLRRHLKDQRELVLLPRALITPLALDELRSRGVSIKRQETTPKAGTSPALKDQQGWAYWTEQASPVVSATVAGLEREGMRLVALKPEGADPSVWLATVGRWVAHQGGGAVLFGLDAALNCCLANKLAGVRAAVVANGWQARRALATLGANVFTVELPGGTFFEVRQILRAVAGQTPRCPPNIAELVGKLESHAHR